MDDRAVVVVAVVVTEPLVIVPNDLVDGVYLQRTRQKTARCENL